MKRLASYRIFIIVSMSMKFFLQVYFFKRRHRGDNSAATTAKWERLVTKQAKEYNKKALALGGLMIKVGQFLASRADIMPPSFLAELEGLTDRVPPVKPKDAMAVLEEDWGRQVSEVLDWISPEAVASASIGEVYKGTLPTGEAVAIKIQRPNIARIIAIDFKAVRIVIWLAKKFTSFSKQLDFDLLYQEMQEVLLPELHFLQELQNGKNFQARFPDTRIPRYFENYSTDRVLVMEWVESSRISDTAFLDKHHIDRKNLTEQLVTLFLQQVLVGGQFHADPHPGNILVEPDGTLVLIDFGMVGTVTDADATAIAKLASGILFTNYDLVIDALEEMGFLLPSADKNVLAKAIEKVVNAYQSNELMQINGAVVEELMEDLQQIVRTQPVQLPARFAFLGRAISTLAGVLYIVDPSVDLMEIAKPQITEWVKEEAKRKDTLKNFGKQAIDELRLLQRLPRKLEKWLEEPEKWRLALQQQPKNTWQGGRILATSFASISLVALYMGIFTEHERLLYTSAPVLIISAFFALKKQKM